jgi:hypothetical protein
LYCQQQDRRVKVFDFIFVPSILVLFLQKPWSHSQAALFHSSRPRGFHVSSGWPFYFEQGKRAALLPIKVLPLLVPRTPLILPKIFVSVSQQAQDTATSPESVGCHETGQRHDHLNPNL